MINYGRQYIDSDDVKAVLRVLKSDWLTQGPQIQKFENSLKAYFNSNYCTVLSSGTAALHLAVLTLGWNKEDIVITTPISFLATSNCILYCGATPSFVDIESKYFTIDVEKLEQKIKLFKKREKKIVGIIATDYAGHPCDWKSLRKIADRYGLKLINDNCHALGAQIDNDKGYAIKYADLVTHSYHPVKNITTGEGGSILTNNKYLARSMRSFREHGIERNPLEFDTHSHGPWFYQQKNIGYNYRLSDLHAALGISQLKKINKFTKKRNLISKHYINNLKNLPILFQKKIKNTFSSYHLFIILVFPDCHLKLFKFLRANKIIVNLHYIPIYLHPFFKKKYNPKNFQNSNSYYSRAISLPIFYQLTIKQQNFIISKIKLFYKRNNE